jgi:poly(A)-specific ribonuclease
MIPTETFVALTESKYLFADQAEAVYPLPEDQLRDNVDGNVISGVHDGILGLASIKNGDGTKCGTKNQEDSDISCQEILDVIHFAKRMRS